MAKRKFRIEGGNYGGECVIGEVKNAFVQQAIDLDEGELIDRVLEAEEWEQPEPADIEEHVVGMLLAYGGGAIVYVACTELFPRGGETMIESDPYAFSKRVLGILSFIIGTIVVSLVLLDHEHCEGGGHSH